MAAHRVPTALHVASFVRMLKLRLTQRELAVSVIASWMRLKHRKHLTVGTVIPDRRQRDPMQSFWRRGEMCLMCRKDWPVRPRK